MNIPDARAAEGISGSLIGVVLSGTVFTDSVTEDVVMGSVTAAIVSGGFLFSEMFISDKSGMLV